MVAGAVARRLNRKLCFGEARTRSLFSCWRLAPETLPHTRSLLGSELLLCRRFRTVKDADPDETDFHKRYKQALEKMKALEEEKKANAEKMKALEEEKKADAEKMKADAEKMKALEEELKGLKEERYPLKANSYVQPDAMEIKREMGLAASCYGEIYKGNGASTLKRILESRLTDFTEGKHYSKYVAITNSSCMGKTKTVLELGRQQVFVFYCSTAKPGSSTYPPRTLGLADELESASGSTVAMTLYLLAWLHELLDFVKGKDVEKGDLAREWLEIQESSFKVDQKEKLSHKVLQRWRNLTKEHRADFTGAFEVMAQEEWKLQQKLVKDIEDVLKELNYKKGLKLLYVMDEVKGLLRDNSSLEANLPMRNVPFLHLRRACRKLGRGTLLVVMDTSARVGELAPAGEDDESRRARIISTELLRPVCRVNNLDLLVVDEDEPGARGIKEWLEDPRRWTKYGRALWGLRFERERDILNLLNIAQAKLLNISKVASRKSESEVERKKQTKLLEIEPSKLSEEQATSLFAFTVGIEILPGHHLAQDMSASNLTAMAIISEDRRRFWTVAPVEPVLSAAAGAFFQDAAVLCKALELLKNSLQADHTVMNGRQRAQLVSNTYLMMAMWQCQGKEAGMLNCVRTLDLMRMLIGDYADKLPAVLQDSFVFFNRIICLDHPPSRKEALEYVKRGCMCTGSLDNTRRGADSYFFVLCRSKDANGQRTGEFALTEDNITYAVTSVKTAEITSEAKSKLRAQHMGIRISDGLPYITMIHGVQDEGGEYCRRIFLPEDEPKGRWGVSLHGLRGPIAEGDYKNCIPLLRQMLHVNPVLCAEEEDRSTYAQYNPWTFASLLPRHLKERVEEDKLLFRNVPEEDIEGRKRLDEAIRARGLRI